jgi:hypothetical protein
VQSEYHKIDSKNQNNKIPQQFFINHIQVIPLKLIKLVHPVIHVLELFYLRHALLVIAHARYHHQTLIQYIQQVSIEIHHDNRIYHNMNQSLQHEHLIQENYITEIINVLSLPEYSSSSPLINAPQGPIAVIDAD